MKRLQTREVMIGKVILGGNHPIRIQSMTNTDTLNIDATFQQIIKLYQAGCDIVRMAILGRKWIASCEKIKQKLRENNCPIPLVADVHFCPNAAMEAVDVVEKVRINPGNFPKKDFLPLVEKCKKKKKALRIGVNLGSLSSRIMDQWGHTPKAMVASATEYIRICRETDFHNIVISMKASDPFSTIEAHRLFVKEMRVLKWDYPLHLGVTEAGEGMDGRIKSAIGIGTLLLEGIGDTIRVSLTEDPVKEIQEAKTLLKYVKRNAYQRKEKLSRKVVFPKNFQKRTLAIMRVPYSLKEKFSSLDGLVVDKLEQGASSPISLFFKEKERSFFTLLQEKKEKNFAVYLSFSNKEKWQQLLSFPSKMIFFDVRDKKIDAIYQLQTYLIEKKIDLPLIACVSYPGKKEETIIQAAMELGVLFFDHLIDGVYWQVKNCSIKKIQEGYDYFLSLLQACRRRFFKAEYVSCPGCGRTPFDLEKIVKEIKKETSHLKEIKIAIMGCVVNGLGEVKQSDFGVIGSGKEKVDLYVGGACVEKRVSFLEAKDRLIFWIRKEKKWKDP